MSALEKEVMPSVLCTEFIALNMYMFGMYQFCKDFFWNME